MKNTSTSKATKKNRTPIKSNKTAKNLTISKMKLSDFIIKSFNAVELTPEEIAELQPERPVINYSTFTLNPDEENCEYDF